MSRNQKRRYGFAAGLIILGFVCAAVSTGTIGGALATVFVAGGLLLFLFFLFGDLGLTVDGGARRRTPAASGAQPPQTTPHPQAPPPDIARPDAAAGAAAPKDTQPAPRPADGGRPHATTRRPARLRGDRRRPS